MKATELIKHLLISSARMTVSLFFAGLLYFGWMAIAITVIKLDCGFFLKAILWLFAPIATAAGYTTGIVIFDGITKTRRFQVRRTFKWALAGCAGGAIAVVWFGPMLIVFGMFLVGTAAIALREVTIIATQQID